ncbi:MAG: GGDEF domain-containing protein [Aquabacterium sp.]|jgi:diguanylate cyclase (GGDEF)-like protein|nr:MAG: GGDEF domain-containing protein [Aquabacterium sp.]
MTDPKPPSTDAFVQAVLTALTSTGAVLMVKDVASGRYQQVEGDVESLIGRARDQVLGHTDAEVFSASQALALRAADQQALAQAGSPATAEHRFERAGGTRQELSVVRLALPEGPDGSRAVLALWQDHSEHRLREAQLRSALDQLEQQHKVNDELRREAQGQHVRDSATGLYQRAHFEEQLRREADLSAREHREFALVAIAIDGLDELAQAHGPQSRQRVLEILGRLLRANTRAMDSPCSLGGERFGILLSGVGLATAHARMEQLRRQCAEHITTLGGQQLSFTVSMGVASYPHTAGTVEHLLKAAEAAQVSARERGGNRVVLASIQFEVA